MDSTPLIIKRSDLKELSDIALTANIPKISELPYTEFQQVLVIHALTVWIESFGIKAPFKLEI